jgi:hypothetical protein
MAPKPFFIMLLILLYSRNTSSQILLNGNFSLAEVSWGCSPETNAETSYGGSNVLNRVAEVDANASLCQVLTGLFIGNTYLVSLSASRRTGTCPSPNPTNMLVTVSGGVLSAVVTRTNTTFNLSSSAYLFTANSIIHTITFSPGPGMGSSTCGMIVDNISVTFSPLPVELLHFDGVFRNGRVHFTWATATEKNNDFFEVERSGDGLDFEPLVLVSSRAGQGNSHTRLEYSCTDPQPLPGITYYRLRQTDLDKRSSVSKVIAVSAASSSAPLLLYPNPSAGAFHVEAEGPGSVQLTVIGSGGETVFSEVLHLNPGSVSIPVQLPGTIPRGLYVCTLRGDQFIRKASFIIE